MSRTRCIFATLVVVLLGIGAVYWTIALTAEPDTRVSIVWPGKASSITMGGPRQLELGQELVQQKAAAEIIGVRSETKQTFIVRRELLSLKLFVTAGDHAIQPGELRYLLLDNEGNEIGTGIVQQENEIAPNAKAIGVIADIAVQEAAVVRIVSAAR